MIILLDYILNPIDEDLTILVLLLKTKPAVSKKKTDSAIQVYYSVILTNSMAVFWKMASLLSSTIMYQYYYIHTTSPKSHLCCIKDLEFDHQSHPLENKTKRAVVGGRGSHIGLQKSGSTRYIYLFGSFPVSFQIYRHLIPITSDASKQIILNWMISLSEILKRKET